MQKTKAAFCPACQAVTNHTVAIDASEEYVFTCAKGDSFFKLPADFDMKGLDAWLEKYKESNEGRLSLASLEKSHKEKLALIQ